MFRIFLSGCVAAALSVSSQAAVISQWNFNSVVPDANTATGTTTPSTGAGTASSAGGTALSFASGDASGGSSDPATGDDTGLGLTTFPAAAGTNLVAGARFDVSTVGFNSLTVNYDLRQSNTSSRFSAFQYTTDGTNFITITDPSIITAGTDPGATITGSVTAGGLLTRTNGDRWLNVNTVNLAALAGVDNNPNFGFRIVAAQDPSTSTYVASNPASTYAAGGTYRFDMVTLNGTASVPEPSSLALIGIATGAGLLVHRTSKKRLPEVA